MEAQECLMSTTGKVKVVKADIRKKKPLVRMDGPDGGYAWGVALAACLINFIMAGLGRMSGILYVAFIDMYGVSRKGATAPFSIRSSTRNLLGPVVGILGQQYGVRAVTLTGGLIGVISAVCCYFADDMFWITFLWGGVNGLGTAFTMTLPQVVIGKYFKKYYTTASGMTFSGGCVGSFLFPALMEYLLFNYGLQGTFLIIAGIIMHVIPAAMILREPPWLRNKKNSSSSVQMPEMTVEEGIKKNNDCNGQLNYNETAIPQTNGSIPDKPCIENSLTKLTQQGLTSSVSNNSVDNVPVNFSYFLRDPSYVADVVIDSYQFIKRRSSDLGNLENNMQSEIDKSLFLSLLNEVYTEGMWERKVQEYEKRTTRGRTSKASLSSFRSLHASFCRSKGGDHNKSENARKPKLSIISMDIAENLEKITGIEKCQKDVPAETLREYKGIILFTLKSLSEEHELKNVLDTIFCQKHNSDDDHKISNILNELVLVYKLHIDSEKREACRKQAEDIELLQPLDTLSVDIELNESAVVLPAAMNAENQNNKSSSTKVKSNSFIEHIKTALKLNLNPIFHLICLCRAIHFMTFIPVMTVVVDFGMDKGFLEEEGKYIIGALSFGDLLGRLCLGWVTDKGYLTLPKYMLIFMVVQGASTATLPFCTTRGTLYCVLAIFGMLQGSVFIRHPVLVTKYMASHEQFIAMGCINFLSGFLGFGLPSYIGYFRDTRGSYDEMFYITGTLGSFIGFIWIFEPYFAKFTSLSENEEAEDDWEKQ